MICTSSSGFMPAWARSAAREQPGLRWRGPGLSPPSAARRKAGLVRPDRQVADVQHIQQGVGLFFDLPLFRGGGASCRGRPRAGRSRSWRSGPSSRVRDRSCTATTAGSERSSADYPWRRCGRGARPADPLAVKIDVPVGGIVDAGDQVEDGGLAGALGDEPRSGRARRTARSQLHRPQAAELVGDIVNLKEGHRAPFQGPFSV